MLPAPNTAYRSKPNGGRNGHNSFFVAGAFTTNSAQSLAERLRARTRLTNLAVALLVLGLGASALINANLWLSTRYPNGYRSHHDSFDRDQAHHHSPPLNLQKNNAPSIEATIERTGEIAGLTHLIMVAGHAIWKGADPEKREEDDEWVLTPIQKGGSVRTFYKHIEAGVKEVLADPHSLLIFSGGQTRPDTPPSTESQSYLRLATASHLLPAAPEFMRATTEEFALDSYTNLLFSYARFKEVTGRWPEKVTVVGFEMKRARFEQLHRVAMKIPEEDFRYIGIDDEGDTTASYEGEKTYGYQPFSEDLYGCFPPLSIKRISRNPFSRYHPYYTSSPELAGLMDWCPVHKAHAQGVEKGIYPGKVPWEAPGGLSWSREQD